MFVPSSCGRTVAKVVLPSPGGPSKRICERGSLSFLQALRAMVNRWTTAFWPTTSRRRRGRRAVSRCFWTSGGSAFTIGCRAMNRLGTKDHCKLQNANLQFAFCNCRFTVCLVSLLINLQQDVFHGLERLPSAESLIQEVASVQGRVADCQQRSIG